MSGGNGVSSPRRSRWRRIVLALAALLAVVLLVPLERYRPSCGGWRYRTYLDGPMRDEYVGMLTELLAEEGFLYVRIGNEVFVKLVYPLQAFNRPPKWDSLFTLLINYEWRFARSISAGYGPNHNRINPPQPLLDAMARYQALRGSIKEPGNWEEVWERGRVFDDDCELLRAATIRVEDMDPERMLTYVPEPSLPALCGFGNVRAWDPRCGATVRGTGDNAVVVTRTWGR